MKKLFISVVAVLSVAMASQVFAGEAAVRKALKKLDPNTKITSVKPSRISGLYEVMIGVEIFYVSSDGKYIVSGNLFETKTQKNLTAQSLGKVYLKFVNKAGEKSMIIYEPKKIKRNLTVFTDLDCPYCRKFHKDVPRHLKNGIRIRYVMFPLQGLQASTYKKSVSVWCSKDRNKAMDIAKSGGSINSKECKNPVADNLALVRKLGISSTPTLMTEDGVLMPGYLPADVLAARLGLTSSKQAKK